MKERILFYGERKISQQSMISSIFTCSKSHFFYRCISNGIRFVQHDDNVDEDDDDYVISETSQCDFKKPIIQGMEIVIKMNISKKNCFLMKRWNWILHETHMDTIWL